MNILLFIVLGLAVFALMLALQMRWMISVALRRALTEKFGGLPSDIEYRAGVADAGRRVSHTDIATHLNQTYPNQLGHLRLARRVSVYTLPVIIGLLVILRFGLEAF
ncbi:MAG: hypothetical protein JJ954_14030 [Hyphomonas sp.]|jgi:hypothetical protein|uniref:hypothetical protein n=1 Tax=Hyphomonas sp. TaxID=87 RepID=UPI001B19F3F6|nr:hypothetical protein [Hyphomonas sp.]MBO6584070.1 hypothetical protein [Hyphomonas sp.]